MKKTRLKNLGEEVQDYIAANFRSDPTADLDYTVGENFMLENYLDIQDLDRIANSKVLLTLYIEGGTLIRSGSQSCYNPAFRFLTKGSYAQAAMDRGRDLLEWLEDLKTFRTTHFRVWITGALKLPGVLARSETGSCMSDFIVSTLAFSRV
jgi:hypothetical protein